MHHGSSSDVASGDEWETPKPSCTNSVNVVFDGDFKLGLKWVLFAQLHCARLINDDRPRQAQRYGPL